MQTSTRNLVRRGASGTFYLRRRIPKHLLSTFPDGKFEIVVSLRTTDRRLAERRLHGEQLRIEATFAAHQAAWEAERQEHEHARPAPSTPAAVTESLLEMALQVDDRWRFLGLSDDQFERYAAAVAAQRATLGKLAARGRVDPLMPALATLLEGLGSDIPTEPTQARELAFALLKGLIQASEIIMRRNEGEIAETATVIAPAPSSAERQKHASWDEVFDVWRDYVTDRPKSTTIAYRTAWNQLRSYMESQQIGSPSAVTSETMTAFVADARQRGLDPGTINQRLTNIRSIFKIAVGKHILRNNPAANTLGVKVGKRTKVAKKRVPFDSADLNKIFSSPVFTGNARSSGSSTEGCYWIPILMFYTGARTEEIAGLRIDDVMPAPDGHGYYLSITDMPSAEDFDLVEDGGHACPGHHVRGLKNSQSRRRMPLAQQVIDLGFLDYLAWLKHQGASMLFPTLTIDTHGKLSGAFSKWFGRFKKTVGIESNRKVLYSFRHGFKAYMDEALIPRKVLQRLMGHSMGDGAISDGYGDEDLPYTLIRKHFESIQFPTIGAKRWILPAQTRISKKGKVPTYTTAE